MLKRILSVIRKEFIEIRRDPRTLMIVLTLPTVMLILYGYAINFDLKSIKTVVYDLDNSRYSREIITGLGNSGYFNIRYVPRYNDIDRQLDSGKAILGICIPRDFSRKIIRGEAAPLQVFLDGSDANTATITLGYINQAMQLYSIKIATSILHISESQMDHALPMIKAQRRVWYNPELKSSNFIVPGLIATISMMLGAVSTALVIVSERENGTLEKLIITPIRPYELVIGKIVPFLILAFIDIIFCLMIGRLWFKVPIRGSISLLLLLATIFLFSTIGQGILISSSVKTQRVAVLIALLTSMMPTFLLSGFVFPIENMPRVLQLITYLVPARYFMEILRGILLKGVGLSVMWINALCLLVYSLLLVLISTVRFQKRLEG